MLVIPKMIEVVHMNQRAYAPKVLNCRSRRNWSPMPSNPLRDALLMRVTSHLKVRQGDAVGLLVSIPSRIGCSTSVTYLGIRHTIGHRSVCGLLIALKCRGMSLVRNIGFDGISYHHLIEFCALIDVNPAFFTIGILDPNIFTFHLHQRPFDRAFRKALPQSRLGLFVRHRVSGLNDSRSKTQYHHGE